MKMRQSLSFNPLIIIQRWPLYTRQKILRLLRTLRYILPVTTILLPKFTLTTALQLCPLDPSCHQLGCPRYIELDADRETDLDKALLFYFVVHKLIPHLHPADAFRWTKPDDTIGSLEIQTMMITWG